MYNVIVTCPPMVRQFDRLSPLINSDTVNFHAAEVVQTLSESELIDLLPYYDGWIIGDDPASAKVFEAAVKGKLKAAVKWGVGVDNVDFTAAHSFNLPISNTPNVFGKEVADLAVCYVGMLARQVLKVHSGVARGEWLKPAGVSLAGKTVGIVGLGDIGLNIAKRLKAAEMLVVGYDPKLEQENEFIDRILEWPENVENLDFLVLACSLNPSTYHMINENIFSKLKPGLMLVNVSRGPLIDELALVRAIERNIVACAALDVYEEEPLGLDNRLRKFEERIIFGSHNGSNTIDAVMRVSLLAADKIKVFLENGQHK